MSTLSSTARPLWPGSRRPFATAAAYPAGAGHALGFGLFLLVTANLFVRPAEVVPELLGLPIYQTLIIVCLAVSASAVARQLSGRSLATHPITVCVLGLLAAIVLSLAVQFNLEGAAQSGWEFVKIVLYYLLVVGLLTTPARLRVFFLFFAACATVMTALAVLQYHEVISLPTITTLKDTQRDTQAGRDITFTRLRSTGIFKDPNDMCLVLVMGIPLSLYGFTERRQGPARFLWLVPALLMAYALFLTKSRGGFLAFVLGLLVFFVARFGWKRAALLAGLALPALLFLFGGRQTELSAGEDTGLHRVQLWSDALMELRGRPLFGVGHDKFKEKAGLVAHNSYLHSYADLGLLGGTLFVGAFYLMLTRLARLGAPRTCVLHPELRRMYPYFLTAVAGYAGMLLTLTSCYLVPTYMVMGLSVAYLDLAQTTPAQPTLRTDGRLGKQLLLVSAGFLIVMYVFVRVFVRW